MRQRVSHILFQTENDQHPRRRLVSCSCFDVDREFYFWFYSNSSLDFCSLFTGIAMNVLIKQRMNASALFAVDIVRHHLAKWFTANCVRALTITIAIFRRWSKFHAENGIVTDVSRRRRRRRVARPRRKSPKMRKRKIRKTQKKQRIRKTIKTIHQLQRRRRWQPLRQRHPRRIRLVQICQLRHRFRPAPTRWRHSGKTIFVLFISFLVQRKRKVSILTMNSIQKLRFRLKIICLILFMFILMKLKI